MPIFIAVEMRPSCVLSGKIINCEIDGYNIANCCNADSIPSEVKYPVNDGVEAASAASLSLPVESNH